MGAFLKDEVDVEILKDIYIEEKEKLINIVRLSNEKNAIHFDFKFQGDRCFHRTTLAEQDGSVNELNEKEFYVDDNFKNQFVLPFVYEYLKTKPQDKIESDVDSLGMYSFRIICDHGDMLTISGIDETFASFLKMEMIEEKIEKIEEIPIQTEVLSGGTGTFYMILLILIILILVILGIMFFM